VALELIRLVEILRWGFWLQITRASKDTNLEIITRDINTIILLFIKLSILYVLYSLFGE
jgi:hypothetical protein